MRLSSICVAAVACAAFSAHAEDTSSWLQLPLKRPLGEVTIGITQYNAGVDSYQSTFEQAFKAYAEELGIKTIVLDPQGDPARQISQMQNLQTQRVDAMIVWPTNAKAVIPQLCRVNHSGLPVVIVDTAVDASGDTCLNAFVGFDNTGEGRAAGEILVAALGGKGNVVVINGVPGYSTAINRETGFMQAAKAAPGITVLDAQPADWNREKAQRLMENYITKYGKKINGVFAADDNMGAGALNAIRAAGVKDGEIKIVGATNFATGYDGIKDGSYAGSITQSPYDEAKHAIRVAVRLAEGQPVEKMNLIATPKVTRDNIAQVSRPTF